MKVHVDFDAERSQPANIALTLARMHDVSLVATRPVEPGATCVLDLG